MQYKQQAYPFSLISSKGLGKTYSSFDKIGPLLPMKGFGAAGLTFYPNVAIGNLFFQDHMLKIEEQGGILELGFIYNSQAASVDPVWQFAHPKFYLLSRYSQQVVLSEADGYRTIYTLDLKSGFFYSETGSRKGIAWLYYQEANQQWVHYRPFDQVTEYFNAEGLLVKRETKAGNITIYYYDAYLRLKEIIGASGNRYKFHYQENTLSLYLVTLDSSEQLLQSYLFDLEGRLTLSQTPDGYQTQYFYSEVSARQLLAVKQSDQTMLGFGYDHSNRLVECCLGDASTFTLQYPNETQPDFLFSDPVGGTTSLKLNDQVAIIEIARSQGIGADFKEKLITAYHYNALTQLTLILHPNQGQEGLSYTDRFGLVRLNEGPNGQMVEQVYEEEAMAVRLVADIQYETVHGRKNTLLATYYVYDTDFNHQYTFLRFKINPLGNVTEYRPDRCGNIASERTYLGGIFDRNQRDPRQAPTLSEIKAWVSLQDAAKVNLVAYEYNLRGQWQHYCQYAEVDQAGKGKLDEAMGQIYTFRTLYGEPFFKQVKQNNIQAAVTRQRFDALERLLSRTDALNQTTTDDYFDAKGQVKIIYPNGKIEIRQQDARGNGVSLQEIVAEQERLTQYRRDANGRVVLTTRPDGEFLYTFFDHQDRLKFCVTALGIVTQQVYAVKNRFVSTTVYAKCIDTRQLWPSDPPPPGSLPQVDRLIALLPGIADESIDQTHYTFFDFSDRPIYEVDEEGYVTQFQYNARNQKRVEIAYANPLEDEQLAELKAGKTLALPIDFNQDRVKRDFYDNSGALIGEQNSAGYVTEYVLDGAGNTKECIRYHTPMPLDLALRDFDQVRPNAALLDAHTYYFRNSKGALVGQFDPADRWGEYYYTAHHAYPNGLIQKSIRYSTKVSFPLLLPPPANPEADEITLYRYDLLGRLLETVFPNQKKDRLQYNVSGNVISAKSQDLHFPDLMDPDHQRARHAHYDAWGQKVKETNEFDGEIFHHYDPITGLKTHTTDALNRTTYYFYDLDQRWVASVNPVGAVVKYERDAFGERIKTIRYATPAKGIPTGGYLTPEIEKHFIADPEKDQVVLFKRNRLSQVVEQIDAKGNMSTFKHNGFKQVVEKNLPVAGPHPTLRLSHEFEVRGLAINTRIEALDTPVEHIERAYANFYGKETYKKDARGGVYRTFYGCRGLVSQKIQESGAGEASHFFTYNAFEALATETDALNQTTTYHYNHLARQHTLHFPVHGVTQTLIHNIFDEKIQETDSLGNRQRFEHAANGQVQIDEDPLGHITRSEFDLMGQLESKIDAKGVETRFKYNEAGDLLFQIEDAAGLGLQTHYQRDVFGNALQITNPRQVVTQNTYDQTNCLTSSVLDAIDSGLNLTIHPTYNAMGKEEGKQQGDKVNPLQYEEKYPLDGRGRQIGKTLDPTGLALAAHQHLNAAGDVIAEVDFNGNVTRKFYDDFGQLRFVVDPEGGVTETNYDLVNRIHYTRLYEKSINPDQLTDQTDLHTLLGLVEVDSQDSILFYFYDADGLARFEVNGLGVVAEGATT